jgi:hypothetical protein
MNAYRIWLGKPKGKGPLGRPGRTPGRENNTKMDIR